MSEGEVKLKASQKEGEKTYLQTSHHGQASIRRELDTLKQEWDSLQSNMKETQRTLQHGIKALETYDVSCESLSQWLRETEIQLKDCELKSTLAEKQNQVEKLKVGHVSHPCKPGPCILMLVCIDTWSWIHKRPRH